MIITYIVHSTSSDNESGICSGWSDPELSDVGLSQARSLAEVLQAHYFDTILVSDLIRAKQTAEIVFPNRTVILDPRLREMNYGEMNGKEKNLFTHNAGWEIRNKYKHGECCLDVQMRIQSLLLDLIKIDSEQSVAFISHKYTQLALEVICNGSTWENAIERDWRKVGTWQPTWEYRFIG